MLTHIKSNDNHWTVVIDGKPLQFDNTHQRYFDLVECVKAGDAKEFVTLLDKGKEIENWSDGNFEFRDGFLYFENEQVATDPTNRIVEMIRQGFPCHSMLNYLANLYENVSERSIQESYKWSSHKGLPITEDGMLVGYKGVRHHKGETFNANNGEVKDGDLVDIYTGKTFRNNVGDKCSMKRRQVCDDHTIGCDSGLHVGTYKYATDWAGPNGVVVLVKFNPKDIVSVPSDSEHQKMRVCEYEVIAVAREQLEDAVYMDDEYDDDHDDYYSDDQFDYDDDKDDDIEHNFYDEEFEFPTPKQKGDGYYDSLDDNQAVY